MLKRLTALLMLAASAQATGLWRDGVEQLSASESIVTNAIPVVQNVTNWSFDTGSGGWVDLVGVLTWTNLPSGGGSMYGRHITDSETPSFKFVYDPVVGETNPLVVTMRYWFTNAQQHSLTFQILNEGEAEYSSAADITNPGAANQTNSATLRVEASQNGYERTNLIVYIEGPTGGGTNIAHLFIDSITVTSQPADVAITTNAAAGGASGTTLNGAVPLSPVKGIFLNGGRAP